MKKLVILFCLVGSAILILHNGEIVNSLLLFVMIGILPGTNVHIPATSMLLLFIFITFLVLSWFIMIHAVHYLSVNHLAKTQYRVTKRGIVQRLPSKRLAL